MIITVLWEDQRGAEAKGFGPHELLLSCVADDVPISRAKLSASVESHPKKGNGNVRRALQRDIERLASSGPVLAVVDRDRIRDLWRDPPPDCMTGIAQRFRQDTPGAYDLVFLVQNVETLICAACSVMVIPVPAGKPNPDERDRLLARAAWGARDVRTAIRKACASFDRIVARVVRSLPLPDEAP